MDKFNKIVLVSLCDTYTKNLGTLLSQNLDMLFCDTKDLIEYELIDKKALEENCSKEYLKASEQKVLRHLASFVNVVVAINFDYLWHNIKLLEKGSLIVFLNLPKNYVKENGNVVDVIGYEERSKNLEKIATATVKIKKTDISFVCEKVISTLGGIL